MKKFVAALVFLTLICVGASAYTLVIKAYDVVSNAELFGITVFKGTLPIGVTPYTGILEAGSYSVTDGSIPQCYTIWQPNSVVVQTEAGDRTINFFGFPEGQCVPVELTSFTTAFTVDKKVKLTWVSQSEVIMLGYRLYRSETNNQASAELITPTMVEATNTSTEQTYSHIDTEVETGHKYYYWLESVDMFGSEFFGPVSVDIQNEVPPVEHQNLLAAYPNPFKAGEGTLKVDVKTTGTVTIYNVLGQVVHTEKVTGPKTIDWKGNACASGIYFYKLSTPTTSQTKKLVIVD